MVRGLLNRLRAVTGIYEIGFNPSSVMGVLLPIAFVVLVGGIGVLLVFLS